MDRLRMAEAQPTDPVDKKHYLSRKQAKSSGAGDVEQAQRAECVAEDRMQWRSSYQGVRVSAHFARQRAAFQELSAKRAADILLG